MDHRVGRRWEVDLPVQVAATGCARAGRLVDLSRNGARLRLGSCDLEPGMAVEIGIPGLEESAHGLVIHVTGASAGLLWSQRSADVDRLLASVRRHGRRRPGGAKVRAGA